MKKLALLVLSIFCLSIVSVQAADTTTTTNDNERPSFEHMGPPPQGEMNESDGATTSRQTPPNGDFKGGKRPSKKPDSMPGGDRVPPEFSQNSNNSVTTDK